MQDGSARKRVTAVVFASCALLLPLAYSPGASAQSRTQAKPVDEVKAAFVYQFALFVQWPESAFEASASPLKIGVVENGEVLSALQKIVSGKQIDGHPVEILQVDVREGTHDCHIVFVDETASGWLSSFIGEDGKSTVLTVGDSPEFTKMGGVIRLFEKGRKLGIEVNVDAADRAQLKISSKLLRLATIVHNGQAESP